jgi:hypothetical protein
MYSGLEGSFSIFSLILRMWTVTVETSPLLSYPQILSNRWSLLKTWSGFNARKVRTSNSFVVKVISLLLTKTRREEGSMKV